ncbi:MAG: type I pantothenate kinase [Actinomycetota bacterium]|nr:type I pantothenate kinase [Actinomycetota bacterium]
MAADDEVGSAAKNEVGVGRAAPPDGTVSPFVALDRAEWAALRDQTPMTLTQDEVTRLGGLTDPIDTEEAADIYLPLSRLLSMYVAGKGSLYRVTSTFLGERAQRTPFVIGVAGSVAVGKSTTSRVLRELLSRWPDTPRVDLVTTDGFLYPNAVLEERNLMMRKGFPESYDRRALLRFVAAVKSGAAEVRAPRYDHLTYDILAGEQIVVHRPDVLIVEGLNVLQPARASSEDFPGALAVSDYFDFSIYVDANSSDVLGWFVERFLSLRRTAFADPESFFHRFAALSDGEAVELATEIWQSINEPNLRENILPTRARANLVLRKGPGHAVEKVFLRKL